MRPPGLPRFLPRGPYRRRRVADAARILPFATAFLFFLPVLWGPARSPEPDTAPSAVYLFTCWTLAIVAAFLFSRRLGGADENRSNPKPRGEEGG